jgi:hypothetical protein
MKGGWQSCASRLTSSCSERSKRQRAAAQLRRQASGGEVNMKLTGQCLCGSVKYTFEGNPAFVFLCHCHDCQQSGGSLVHFGVMVPEPGFNRQGEVRAYTKRGDAGRQITREFCPVCGSGISNRLEAAPGTVVIKGGTLDDPLMISPSFELFTRSKVLSLSSGAQLPCFEEGLTADPSTVTWKA